MTYVFHRYGLHSEQSPLTKTHANWQHTVPAPFSLVAHYDHPIAYLIHVFLPTYLPAVLFRFHLLTYLLYLAVISLEETFAYSGYNVLPSAFVLGGIARRQEKHIMGGGNGNYGCFGLVDLAMGTSIGEDLMDDVMDEAEGGKVAKKTKRKVKVAGKKVLKNVPKKKEDDRESEEENGKGGAAETEEAEADEENEEEEEEEDVAPNPKTKGSGVNVNGKKGANTHEEDADGIFPEENNPSPGKKPSRTRRKEKKSSGEDAEAGGQDEESKTEEERSKPKARGVARKGSQKSKTAGRPRKRSEDNNE